MSDRPGIWMGDRRLLTVGLIGLVTAVAFEGMAVATVLPATARDLDGLALYGWAFSAFWLTNILGITLAGSDADRHGPRRAFIAGFLLFAAGLVLAAVATGMPMLIAGRAVQGFGSGAIGAVVYIIIARAYPAILHPRMLAITSSAWVVPGLLGPALAAWITATFDWRWVFGALALPVVAIGVAALRPISTLLPVEEPAGDRRRRALHALRLSIGSLLFLSSFTVAAWLLAVPVGLVGAWLTVSALRHLLPDGALLVRPGPAAVPPLVFAVTFAFFGAEAYVPLAVTEVRGGGLEAGALALSAAAISWTAGSWLQARLVPRGWRRGLVGIGMVLIAAGIALVGLVLLPGVPVYVAAVAWSVAGLGMGLAYTTLSLLVLESAAPGREGSASAALQLMFTLGTAFGTGIGGACVALADAGVLGLATAIGLAFAVSAVAVLAAALGSGRLPRAGRASVVPHLEPFDSAAVPPVP